MQPNPANSMGDTRADRPIRAFEPPNVSRSTTNTRPSVAEDSWIEISSGPSSSSISSIGDNEVVTTGLRLRHHGSSRHPHRLRIHTLSQPAPTPANGPLSANGSSQDEYEESESESDRVLGSSNEDMAQILKQEDDDDVSTALGVGNADHNVFTPQPNAFSHPPSTRTTRNTIGGPGTESYFPPMPADPSMLDPTKYTFDRTITQRSVDRQRHSFPRSFPDHPPSFREHSARPSSSQPDHDAALRASLTTLLSCAAAVRGSPKRQEPLRPASPRRRSHGGIQRLRLVPESQLLSEGSEDSHRASAKRSAGADNLPPAKQPSLVKRKARESSKERHAKKSRSTTVSDEDAMNSTLMSWMISAGVVLVFSAISFSAGYAWGKEVGRIEGEMGFTTNSCGQEAMRSGSGLRRLKWTTATTSIRA